ncbi:hypothetical protein [Eubacterium limosum]|uniref:hypothetical protein n=1 Tax=Eubacterium limosum TaxID=1736 RepID=UPI0010626466|nr:hypothetical protein [Eubacterium limosum]
MKSGTHWSFNYINDEYWNNDSYDSKEEAEDAGRIWAKEEGLIAFEVGECEYVPIPTVVDLDDLFERLDYDYFYSNEFDDCDFYPYQDSVTLESEVYRKKLSAKITEALEEYVEAAKITSSHYRVVNMYRVEVEE